MPFWKQRMFARLMKPADDDGSDLGGGPSVLESAIDQVGEPQAAAAETPDSDSQGTGDDQTQAADTTPQPEDLPTDKPQSKKMLDLLDELSADPKPAPKADPNPAQDPAPAKAETPPAADPADPKNPEQEEAELLEGVKSERGKERIRQVFAERKQLETDITEFRELVKSTGMSAQEFATTLEFGRLINSGDEKNIRVALEMIEGQRAMLYQKLGVEAPGVDLLDGQDDLKAAVENMEITRERAVELAKYRKTEAVKTAQAQQEQQATQSREQYQQTVSAASQQMEAYLETRKNEVDHTARMKVISDHFRKPENVQAFVQTYQPNQWMTTIKMMYDGIVVPKASPAPSPQPLRSRPATLGTPTASAASPMDRLAQHIDNLGI
jgi:hypothetical protein